MMNRNTRITARTIVAMIAALGRKSTLAHSTDLSLAAFAYSRKPNTITTASATRKPVQPRKRFKRALEDAIGPFQAGRRLCLCCFRKREQREAGGGWTKPGRPCRNGRQAGRRVRGLSA